MSFEPRISIVSLGVSDLTRSTAFYEALGFKKNGSSNESITFFQMGSGVIFGLYGRAALAEDAEVEDTGPGGFSGVTLAYNVRDESEVAERLSDAVAVGATLKKPAQKVFWGGTSGYFADPDGHLWEVAHNPFFPLNVDGGVHLPEGA